MMQLLVRNRVRDFGAWLQVYEEDAAARESGGLHAVSPWRNAGG